MALTGSGEKDRTGLEPHTHPHTNDGYWGGERNEVILEVIQHPARNCERVSCLLSSNWKEKQNTNTQASTVATVHRHRTLEYTVKLILS